MDVRLKSQWQLRQPEPPTDVPLNDTEASPFASAESTVRWTKLAKLSHVLYPTTSPYGRPTISLCCPKNLLVGTDSADVLVFDYEQRLTAQLSARVLETALGEVTALNVSADGTHVVAGFSQGWVCFWDLEAPPKGNPRLRAAVEPLSANRVPTPQSRVQGHESHVTGTPVKFVAFSSGKHSKFVSVDAGGLVVLHRHHRVLLEQTTKSRRILGSFVGGPHVLDVAILEQYIAILTPELLLVVEVVPDGAVERLKVPRSKDTRDRDNDYGVLRFNPLSRQLAYSWGSQLKILTMDPDNHFTADKAFTHAAPVEWFDWIDTRSGMTVVLSSPQKRPQLDLVLINDAQVVASEPLSPSSRLLQLQVSTSTLFAMGKYEFSIGQLRNWADRLLALLNNAHPTEAIELAMTYFGSEGNMSVLGLPAERPLRQRILRSALPDLVLTALQFSINFDLESLKRLLPSSVRAAALMSPPLLESILELISSSDEQWIHELYHNSIVSLVLQGQIRALPPPVFRQLVIHKHSVQQIFYMLDLSGLDLDLAFKLCAQNPELAEVEIYLRNQALDDFVTLLSPPTSHTMGYLALTLTGRVYPTGAFAVDEHKMLKAKIEIYKSLFLADTTTLLQSLIDYDEKGFFTALNEAFEDSFLNDNAEINRQVIVNVLRSPGVQTHGVFLSIFLSRNYPKYRQFLVLPGQVLQQVALNLCQQPNSEAEECQLALLSMLSVYNATDAQNFINALSEANYTIVLEHIYRRQGKYRDLVLLKLRNHEPDLWTTLEESLVVNRASISRLVHENIPKLLAESVERFAELVSQHRDTSLWTEVLAAADESQKFAFLDFAFTYIGRVGGPLPPLRIRTEYVTLLARQSSEDSSRLMLVLNTILTGPEDIQLPLIVDDLLEKGYVDVLALLLCRRNRETEAMIYILNHISSLDGSMLAQYARLAASICLDVSKHSGIEGTRLWQRLLETLLSMEGATAQTEMRNIVRVLSESGSTALIDITANLLSSGGKPGIAPVVSQLFLDLYRQERTLKSFFDILETDTYKHLIAALAGRVQGWMVPVDGECEICGRKIVGLGVDANSLYEAWEQAGMKEGITSTADSLIVFQCRHHYHFDCLSRMANGDLFEPSNRKCVLCDTVSLP